MSTANFLNVVCSMSHLESIAFTYVYNVLCCSTCKDIKVSLYFHQGEPYTKSGGAENDEVCICNICSLDSPSLVCKLVLAHLCQAFAPFIFMNVGNGRQWISCVRTSGSVIQFPVPSSLYI